MHYSFVECLDGEMSVCCYDDEDEAIGFAFARLTEMAFDDYWCKVCLINDFGETELFYSEEAWALLALYSSKKMFGEELAREWVRDEIRSFNPEKIMVYDRFVESYYGFRL